VFKILKSKRRDIPLIYLIVLLLFFVACFLPIYSYYNESDIYPEWDTYYGFSFTSFPLLFYLVGVILLYIRRVNISTAVTAMGNAILGLNFFLFFLYDLYFISKGERYRIEYGFYILIFLWIVLITINILMAVFKADLGVKKPPVQPVNN